MVLLYKAIDKGKKIALIDKGLIGGTCANTGCVPSKMLIYPADVVTAVHHATKLGINAEIISIDFNAIMRRMRDYVAENRKNMEDGIKDIKGVDYFRDEGHFVEDYTLEVGRERIRGRQIFIASGSRGRIPPIKGLDTIDYLTNETLLGLTEKPESMIIIGGGYIAAEYGHFYAAMGTRVTIIQDNDRLLPNEEPEISDLLLHEFKKRMIVHTNMHAEEAQKDGGGCIIKGKDNKTGEMKSFAAQKVLVAVGRQSNADLLKVENTGIETDEKNYIRVSDHLETTKPDIWAFGDAIGRQMFTHAGDREAEIAWHNAVNIGKKKMDFSAVPHAVYTHPQIASIGLTEEQARKHHTILVGQAGYPDIVLGNAMEQDIGFAKAIVEKKSRKILGFHIVGPEAPILLQEVTNAMAKGGAVDDLLEGLHIFPSLSELIPEALGHLEQR